MKRLISLSLVLLISLVLCVTVSAAAKSSRLYDGAELLTDSESEKLTEKLDRLSESLGYDIVIVTVESFGGYDIERYAADRFEEQGFGLGEDMSGSLLLISVRDRDYAMISFGEGEDATPENDYAMDDVIGLLGDNEFYEAFDAYADAVAEAIEDHRAFPWVKYLAVSVAVGLIVALTVVFSMKSKLKTVAPQKGARAYAGNLRLSHCRDLYLFSTVTRVPKPKPSQSGSRRSSSGRSFSGRSGKF